MPPPGRHYKLYHADHPLSPLEPATYKSHLRIFNIGRYSKIMWWDITPIISIQIYFFIVVPLTFVYISLIYQIRTI